MNSIERKADYPIDERFLRRWSPRAFDRTPVSREDLLRLFEAARWAPSSFNAQPWRFVYAIAGTADWDGFVGTLLPFNQLWAANAGALVYILSEKTLADPKTGQRQPSHSHSFDAGTAWAHLALQAAEIGLYTHGMTGVDWEAARALLAVPDEFRIEAAIAIGLMGDKADLPERLLAREFPIGRKSVSELMFAGKFSEDSSKGP